MNFVFKAKMAHYLDQESSSCFEWFKGLSELDRLEVWMTLDHLSKKGGMTANISKLAALQFARFYETESEMLNNDTTV